MTESRAHPIPRSNFLFMMCVNWSAIKHCVYNVFVASGGPPALYLASSHGTALSMVRPSLAPVSDQPHDLLCPRCATLGVGRDPNVVGVEGNFLQVTQLYTSSPFT